MWKVAERALMLEKPMKRRIPAMATKKKAKKTVKKGKKK
jgi:hypothetical protein